MHRHVVHGFKTYRAIGGVGGLVGSGGDPNLRWSVISGGQASFAQSLCEGLISGIPTEPIVTRKRVVFHHQDPIGQTANGTRWDLCPAASTGDSELRSSGRVDGRLVTVRLDVELKIIKVARYPRDGPIDIHIAAGFIIMFAVRIENMAIWGSRQLGQMKTLEDRPQRNVSGRIALLVS
jgi:hypothetical protein